MPCQCAKLGIIMNVASACMRIDDSFMMTRRCVMCYAQERRTTILEHHLFEKTFVVETRLVGERPLPGDPRVSITPFSTASMRTHGNGLRSFTMSCLGFRFLCGPSTVA